MGKRKDKQELRTVFAKNLRRLRLAHGISQEKLADLAGIHRTYLSSVECGSRNVAIDNIERLAKALNTEPAELLRNDR
jgi:transcriptional regulator with XRE-family HTH domain